MTDFQAEIATAVQAGEETGAEVLRRAAGLMRAQAEAATQGPWGATWDKQVVAAYGSSSDGEQLADCFDSDQNAHHIASWHPAVALAVADWLKSVASDVDKRDNPKRVGGRYEALRIPDEFAALAVARTYLGDPA